MASLIPLSPPPPPPPLDADDPQGFSSPAWQGWFTAVYSQLRTQVSTAITSASTAAGAAATALAAAAAAEADAAIAEANAATALTNANTAITTANSAIAAVGAKLNKSAADTLSGAVTVNSGGGFSTGTIAWNSSGTYISGTGVAMTAKGIVGHSTSGTSFAIDSVGNASFAGALSAASGTFAGSLSSANGTFTGTLSSVNGTFTGALTAATGTFAGTLTGVNGTFTGALVSASGTFTGTLTAGHVSGGTIYGATMGFGSGFTPSGYTFELTSGGALWADNFFGGIGSFDNTHIATTTLSANTVNSQTALLAVSNGSGTALDIRSNSSGYGIHFISGSTANMVQSGGGTNFMLSMVPNITGVQLGSPSPAWNDLYVVNSPHITSDIREKTILGPCDRGLELINALETIKFTWNVGKTTILPDEPAVLNPKTGVLAPAVTTDAGKRYHYGIKAQQLQTLLNDPNCAMHSLEDPADPESMQMVRLGELQISMLLAIQQLSAQVTALQGQVTALTTKGA